MIFCCFYCIRFGVQIIDDQEQTVYIVTNPHLIDPASFILLGFPAEVYLYLIIGHLCVHRDRIDLRRSYCARRSTARNPNCCCQCKNYRK